MLNHKNTKETLSTKPYTYKFLKTLLWKYEDLKSKNKNKKSLNLKSSTDKIKKIVS